MWFVFEGLDGVGKSTLLGEVRKVLSAMGFRVQQLSTPLPLFTPMREALERSRRTEMLLGFYVGSAVATALEALQTLASGHADFVLVDRYIYSTLALASGHQVPFPPNVAAVFDTLPLRPSGAFLVKSDEKVRRSRLRERGNLREIEQLESDDVCSRAADAYERLPLQSVYNKDGCLTESAAEVVAWIMHRYRTEV